MKDWLITKTVPSLLNDRVLKPYGALTDFKFDSKLRTAEGELLLRSSYPSVCNVLVIFECR